MEIVTRKEAKDKGLKRYFTGKQCKYGHIDERTASNGACLECTRIKTLRDKGKRSDYFKKHRKEYYQANRDSERLKAREYYNENKSELLVKAKIYRDCNRDARALYSREYREKNRDRMIELQKEWRRNNPLNGAVRKPLERLVDGVNLDRHEADIGYSRNDLISHIESLFSKGMHWGNHGEWEIDHIIPVSAMLKDGIECVKVINALSNLQPLWKEDNTRKGSTLQESQ